MKKAQMIFLIFLLLINSASLTDIIFEFTNAPYMIIYTFITISILFFINQNKEIFYYYFLDD